MNKGRITKTEFELLKNYAPLTTKYLLFEEDDDDDYVTVYFSDLEELVTKLTSDIILNNVKNRDNKLLRITIDEALNQICERMYYY